MSLSSETCREEAGGARRTGGWREPPGEHFLALPSVRTAKQPRASEEQVSRPQQAVALEAIDEARHPGSAQKAVRSASSAIRSRWPGATRSGR